MFDNRNIRLIDPTPATHVAREHYSGMWAVVDTRTGDTRYLYPDQETAERVASKQDAPR